MLDKILVEVEDNGSGIPRRTCRVLETLHRTDNGKVEAGAGGSPRTGAIIVKHIVEGPMAKSGLRFAAK